MKSRGFQKPVKGEKAVVRFRNTVLWIACVLLAAGTLAQEKQEAQDTSKGKAGDAVPVVSFKEDVFPIIKKHCLPCHAEESANPSELALDNYKLLKQGGKHGEAVLAGKPAGSPLVGKLAEKPPFGDRMPLNSRKKVKEGKTKWLTEEDVKTITTWVSQGAKDN